MFKRILVPTDGSNLSNKALNGALELAQQIGATIVGLTVVEPYSYSTMTEVLPENLDHYESRTHALARERLEKLESAAQSAKVLCETTVVKSFSPYEAIIGTARHRQCDAIFMGSHGRSGVAAVLLGSETLKVLSHSNVPVMVYR